MIENDGDIILKITATAICGSGLHLYDGYQPTMEDGDILGHEPMGEVVEVGSDVKKWKKGDRAVVPFLIACGKCWFCENTYYSCCDTTNPNAEMARKVMGQSPAGLFGFSHCSVVMPAARPNSFACLTPMSGRSRSSQACLTRRSSSSPIFFPPDTWPPRTRRSNQATP